jgi:hypothetical protein
MFGIDTNPMVLPAAYQMATAEGGVNVGGIAQELVTALPSLGQDSWLAMGATDGSMALSVTGIDFTTWTAAAGLTVDNGLISYFDESTGVASASGPTSASVIVGQLTVATPANCDSAEVATLNFQGHSQDRGESGVATEDRLNDWQALGVTFTLC